MPRQSQKLSVRIANRLEFAAIGAVRTVLGWFGLTRASAFMGWCWRTVAPLTKRHPRALAQLQASMPDLTEPKRDAIIRAMWDGLGQTFAESLLLDQLIKEPDRVLLDDPSAFDALKTDTSGQGIVFVSLHSGNWEVLGLPLANAGLNVAGLYQAVQNPLLEADLLAQRAGLYRAGMISKGSHAMKRIVRLLRSGHAVAMLADQRQAQRGVAVPFFGQDAPSTPLPASLALRTQARLVLARCKRVGRARYTIALKELPVVASGDHDGDVLALTAAIHAQFETWIRERPEEWMWAHRRWSREVRRPQGS